MDEHRSAIADYGLIGDTRTAALVSSNGAIDWMCLPHFDDEPVFAKLVGGRDGGTFRVGPTADVSPVSRRYRTDTATLETSWKIAGGHLTLTDGMVSEIAGQLLPATLLVRRLTAEGAPIDVTIEFDPRRGVAHHPPRTQRRRLGGLVCTWGALAVALDASPRVTIEAGRPVFVTVTPDRPITLTLAVAHREPLVHVQPEAAWDALEADEQRWQDWAKAIETDVPFRGAVVRSLLTLRLLSYSPSGAPVAAPTTSLPEELGGSRNWDYRYAWPRDASIGVGAFLGVGMHQEALKFLAWLRHASRLDRPRLPVLLTLHGKHPPPENVLDGWPGYANSRPVRTGNDAAEQHQLDGYGWVLDAASILTETGHPIDSETWRAMAGFADEIAARWRNPDAGIWEVRGDQQQHVHSKLMAWLGLDRVLRIAETRHVSAARLRRWRAERDAIAEELRTRGFNVEKRAYTRTYCSDDLDAAVLVLPLVGVEDPDSIRVRDTIDAIARELSAGGPLLYRYAPGDDGLAGSEGAFVPCAFWLVQALAETGRVAEASQRFTELVGLASPLGLFAEEIDPATGDHLGNFPQALSHAALVQGALAIRDAIARDSTTSASCGGPS
jgi:GH15 family glucan-1,4-alpha-glucosidase